MKIPNLNMHYAELIDIRMLWEDKAMRIGLATGIYIKVECSTPNANEECDRIYFKMGGYEFE